jgi:hypothetical protein
MANSLHIYIAYALNVFKTKGPWEMRQEDHKAHRYAVVCGNPIGPPPEVGEPTSTFLIYRATNMIRYIIFPGMTRKLQRTSQGS